MSVHMLECLRTWHRISHQKLSQKNILSILNKPYSFHSVHSAIGRRMNKNEVAPKRTHIPSIPSIHSPKRMRPLINYYKILELSFPLLAFFLIFLLLNLMTNNNEKRVDYITPNRVQSTELKHVDEISRGS